MKTTDFIHQLTWADLPEPVRNQARRCLLDTIGVAIGGRQTNLSNIIYNFAAAACGGQEARLWLDGRQVSLPGAALAHGMTIDALDIHDTCRAVKGHAGAALIPAALASTGHGNGAPVSGQEMLTTLVVGYEVAIRAGKALHATACDYHTSGAWNALGCAAIIARRLGLTGEQTRHALGIAEYHGPRSQMMRCIDYPTMLKDGSGWGAMAGVSAALLAANGFTGAPALTLESAEVSHFWRDLGQQWATLEQVFKPYAVCYWAQAAIAGALTLQQAHNLPVASMQKIKVYAFHEATRLASRRPQTTEEAQYSLPFPVASALVYHRLGFAELNGAALNDSRVLDLAQRVELLEDESFNARFPAERLSRVVIEMNNGDTFDSGEMRPRWDSLAPPADGELLEKFRWLAGDCLPASRAEALAEHLWHCAELSDAASILELLAPAI